MSVLVPTKTTVLFSWYKFCRNDTVTEKKHISQDVNHPSRDIYQWFEDICHFARLYVVSILYVLEDYQWCIMPEDLFDKLPLFKDLNADQRQLLRPLFVPCDCYTDSVLFEQGDRAENLYLVVVGEVVIRYKPDDGPPIVVARVRPGGIVGWSAALGSRFYTSAAECGTYTQMLRVRGTDLRELCEQHPDTGILILERLAEVIAQRLRNTHDQVMALLIQGLGTKNLKEA